MKKLLLNLVLLPTLTSSFLLTTSLNKQSRKVFKKNQKNLKQNLDQKNQSNVNKEKEGKPVLITSKEIEISQVENLEIINSVLKIANLKKEKITPEQFKTIQDLQKQGLSTLDEKQVNIIFNLVKGFIPLIGDFEFLIKPNEKKVPQHLINLGFDLFKNSFNKSENASVELKEKIELFLNKFLFEGFSQQELSQTIKSILTLMEIDLKQSFEIPDQGALFSIVKNLADLDLSYENIINTILKGIYQNNNEWYAGLFKNDVGVLGVDAYSWWTGKNPFENIQLDLLKNIFSKGIFNATENDLQSVVTFFEKIKNDSQFGSLIKDNKNLTKIMKVFLNQQKIEPFVNTIKKAFKEGITKFEKKNYDFIFDILTFMGYEFIDIKEKYLLIDLLTNGFKTTFNSTQIEKIYFFKKNVEKILQTNQIILPIDLNFVFNEFFQFVFNFNPEKVKTEDTRSMFLFLESVKLILEENTLFSKEAKTKYISILNILENKVNNQEIVNEQDIQDFIEVKYLIESVLKR